MQNSRLFLIVKLLPLCTFFGVFWINALAVPSLSYAETLWPGDNGFPRKINTQLHKSTACQHFEKLTKGKIEFKQGIQGLRFSTDQVLVLKDGHIVYEWSDLPNMDMKSPHPMWSVSKSVTAAILGAAIEKKLKLPSKKYLSLETKISQIFPEKQRKSWLKANNKGDKGDWYKDLSFKHLVEMSSGLEWEENYESDVRSVFLQMLFGKGLKNTPQFALSVPMLHKPGRLFNYSGGNTNIIMGALERIHGKEPNLAAKELLFNPIGIKSAFFETDMAGHLLASSHLQMKPEDMLRLGYLFLNDGVWRGTRILPQGWVQRAHQPAEVLLASDHLNTYRQIRKVGTYGGAGLWINKELRGQWMKGQKVKTKIKKFFGDLPEDILFMSGHYGQTILIFPSQNLIIARTGNDKEYWSKMNEYGKAVLQCFTK